VKAAPKARGSAGARLDKKAAPRDPLRIVAAEFLAGAGPGSELPAPTHAEIAFGGRSNVGKSSLINTLVERKSLVRVSSNPGSTRQLNLYEARAADGTVFHLVDLPGYGFTTRRSKSEKASWGTLIEGYLRTRPTLSAVVLLVDVRRGLEEDDRDLVEFVDAVNHPSRRRVEVVLVATKLDKLPKSSRKSALAALSAAAGRRVLGFSSETAEGRTELWRALRRASLGQELTPSEASHDAPSQDAPSHYAPSQDAPSRDAPSQDAPSHADQNG
jgi:GTP-binding protein